MKSEQFGRLYADLARKYGLSFVDASAIVSPSKKDGYHLDPDSHEKLAQVFLGKINKLG